MSLTLEEKLQGILNEIEDQGSETDIQDATEQHNYIKKTSSRNHRNYYRPKAGCKLPIGSKLEKRRRRILYISKFLFISGAIGLIALAVIRFIFVDTNSIHAAIMNLFFIFFGVIIALHSFGLQKLQDQFRFINYHSGKCILSFVLSSMAFSKDQELFMQLLICGYWGIVGIIFLILCFIDKEHDKKQREKDAKF